MKIGHILCAATVAVASVLAVGSYFDGNVATAQMGAHHKPYGDGIVGKDGSISVPKDFRQRYTMLGAWTVKGDADTGDVGMHIVYTQPEVVEIYRNTGEFPDGAVIVKELFNTKEESLTTGLATSVAGVAGYFVMVKDTEGRYQDSPLWGEGWGWAFFSADDTAHTVTDDYVSDCLGCHEPARKSDFIYSYAYPVLTK